MGARHGNNRELNSTPNPQTRTAELWETWRKAQARTGRALNTWYAASRGQKADTYAAYTAALEREAMVADLLAQAAVDGATAAA